jgi:hypothetical protein
MAACGGDDTRKFADTPKVSKSESGSASATFDSVALTCLGADTMIHNIEGKDGKRRAVIRGKLCELYSHLGRLPLDIPEYHDEQRFIRRSDSTYGPMAYVFASPYLEGFKYVNQINAHEALGHFVAVVYVDTDGPGLPDEYTALHLQPGANCVYLAHTGTSTLALWKAYVVPGSEEKGCERPAVLPPPLEAKVRVTARATTDADIPPVARFSETVDGQPLIGVRCLDHWCEIGPSGFVSRDPVHAVAGGLPNTLREAAVLGWGDEQRLGIVVGGNLVPSTIRASVTPMPNLQSRASSYYEADYKTAAVIWLRGDPSSTVYSSQWGMRQGMNILQLKYVSSTKKWLARVGPTDNTGKLLSSASFHEVTVNQVPHYDMVVPGTARFRWQMKDETIWVNCDQGCCQVDGKDAA